jgi:hypothetical protein
MQVEDALPMDGWMSDEEERRRDGEGNRYRTRLLAWLLLETSYEEGIEVVGQV